MTSVAPTGSGPCPSPVNAGPIHQVFVTDTFSWDDLDQTLHDYLSIVQGCWKALQDGYGAPYMQFCKEIEDWLAQPMSKTLNPKESLKMWQSRIDGYLKDLSSDLIDLPPIIICRVKKS